MSSLPVGLYRGPELAAYGFLEKPWFQPDRLDAFLDELASRGLDRRVALLDARPAADEELLLFHTAEHVARVRRLSALDQGTLDHGPTPARRVVEQAATHVVGSVMDGARRLLSGELRRAFVPIAGFHHAHRDEARSYCLYNDCAVVLAFLSRQRIGPIAYVDIDAHFGDGVYRAFAGDPSVVMADVHEDSRTQWPHSPRAPGKDPGVGDRSFRGEGDAAGTKLCIPLAPGATDADFRLAWGEVEAFIEAAHPAFIVFEAGADGLAGDPLANLALSPESLRLATSRLCALAERHAEGRLLVLGGGGYDNANMANGWCAVVEALLDSA